MKIEIRTQAELDAALPKARADESVFLELVAGALRLVTEGLEKLRICVHAGVTVDVEAWGSSQPHVEAWGSSQPHVVARESAQPHVEAWVSSQPHVEARESSQPHVVARESSQPHVEALGSSQPHVVARESSQPHVEAWGSSQPHVEAWGSSQPHVEAWGSSQPHVEARESSQPHVVAEAYAMLSLFGQIVAKCAATVSVVIRGTKASVTGTKRVQRIKIQTPADWCAYYGVEVERGIATLYKAVKGEADYPFQSWGISDRTGQRVTYTPGTEAVAGDWDGAARECGGGLHFSPSPQMALEFARDTQRCKFVACAVALKDIVVHPDGEYPQKVKAEKCRVLYECDRRGRKIETATPAETPKAAEVTA
jgi:hypothetical protein